MRTLARVTMRKMNVMFLRRGLHGVNEARLDIVRNGVAADRQRRANRNGDGAHRVNLAEDRDAQRRRGLGRDRPPRPGMIRTTIRNIGEPILKWRAQDGKRSTFFFTSNASDVRSATT